ncbi:hypothetical protein AVXHC19_26170 [Acidovorax sacchari]
MMGNLEAACPGPGQAEISDREDTGGGRAWAGGMWMRDIPLRGGSTPPSGRRLTSGWGMPGGSAGALLDCECRVSWISASWPGLRVNPGAALVADGVVVVVMVILANVHSCLWIRGTL